MARFVSMLLLLAIALSAESAEGQDWPRFRGPNGAGISDAATVPIQWAPTDTNWKLAIPGRGNSSPITWGNSVYITTAVDAPPSRHLLCIDADDGNIRWQRQLDFQTYKMHKNNSFASNTPCADEDRVYVLWQSQVSSPLVAYDHQGNEQWRYDLGPYRHGQGGGTSPIVFGDLVIVCNDHARGSFLLALNKQSGKQVWRIPRKGRRACYATPCVFAPADRPAEIIFSHCFEGICGVDPKSGEQNWMIHVFGDFPQRAVGSPFVAGDLVIANSGARVADKNLVAVRPGTDGDVQEVYRLTKGAPHVPSAIAYDGLLFAWSDMGIVTCLNIHDGKKLWQHRVGGNYFASPICIDGKLYCADLDGTVVVVDASDTFKVLARNPLGETTMATPAVSGGVMYVRTNSHLYSIGGSDK